MELIQYAPSLGRILIGLLFLLVSLINLRNFALLRGALSQKGFPLAGLLLAIAIIFEACMAVLIIINCHVKLAALLLVPFSLIACSLFHNFWRMEGELRFLNKIIFLGHFTVTIGALLLLTGNITPITSWAELLHY